MLKEHGNELKTMLKGGVGSAVGLAKGLVLYERPLLSLFACVLWQVRDCPACEPLSTQRKRRATASRSARRQCRSRATLPS